MAHPIDMHRSPGTQHGRPNQPRRDDGVQQEQKMLHAPYNFVPLSNWVHSPEWSRAASHDLPFADGYSGVLHLTLTNHTPLLVGGQQQKASKDAPGDVRPFQLPDGRHAIPGSSLKGMLRAVVEIAGFGRMRMVDEQRPALRDISTADSIYANRVHGKIEAGWMRKTEDGGREIVPCQFVHMPHDGLEKLLKHSHKALFSRGQSVAQKYEEWQRLCKQVGRPAEQIRFEIQQDKTGRRIALPHQLGGHAGFPVFTGQVSDSRQANGKGKKHDFLFYSPVPEQRITVNDGVWRDFLKVHGDEEKRDAQAMSWPGYWKSRFWEGKDVPVFYLQDGGVLRIGLAFMPKLAGDYSTRDMICHSSPEHLAPPGLDKGYDFADLLFGAINDSKDPRAQADALRGRVSCGLLVAQGKSQVTQHVPTILNSPKPSYFPNYVTQSKISKPSQYAAYIATSSNRAPTLRGFKRYPVRPMSQTKVQALTPDQEQNKSVQMKLHTVDAGARFTGRIVFHNLKTEELGALLWAVTWGGQPGLRHALGMGKPFGFGQVSLAIDHQISTIIPNDPQQAPRALDAEHIGKLMDAFKGHMEAKAKSSNIVRTGWLASPQLTNLLAMADPEAARKAEAVQDNFLSHPILGVGKNNPFQQAKQSAQVLPDYAVLTGRMAFAPPIQGKPCPKPQITRVNEASVQASAPEPLFQENVKTWTACTVTYDAGKRSVEASGPERGARAVAASLDDVQIDEALKARLRKDKQLRGLIVDVLQKGTSMAQIQSIRKA